MFKRVRKCVLGAAFAVAAFVSICSCSDNVGLGDSVDTEAPKLEITYPPSSAVIKGSFIFAGTSSDDKGVTSMKVVVKKVEDSVSTQIGEARYASVASDGSWKIELNKNDSENASYYNGWEFSDGTYEITATAYDDSGRNTSTSRTFSIDNTAPVLVLTKPTSVGSNTAKSYGQQVQLQGSFSEMSGDGKINMLTVTFYNTDGSVKHESSFESISDLSSANPLTIAQYYDSDSRASLSGEDLVKWENYQALYSAYADFDAGNTPDSEQSYFTVTAYDVAKEYTVVGDSGTGSGNATSVYYRGTSNMLKLIEGKYTDGADLSGFSILSLRNYLNGTDSSYSADSEKAAVLESVLQAAESVSRTSAAGGLSSAQLSNTAVSDGDVFLTFQVNPNNNPKFVASGFAITESKADGSAYSDASSGASGYKIYYIGSDINLSVTPGLDDTNIDTSTVSVYAVPYSVAESDLAQGWDENKVLLWTWNEAVAVSYAAGKSLTDSSSDDYQTWLAKVEADSDSYRYTVTSSDENTDSLSQGASLDETEVTLTKPYYLYVEGEDIDGQKIVDSSSSGYGIWPTTTATVPELTLDASDSAAATNLADDSVLNQAVFTGGLTFTGSASSDTIALTALTYEFTLTNASDSSKTASVSGSLLEGALLSSELPYVYSWSFTAAPSAAMKELLASEGRYKLTVTITAKNSAGAAKETRSIIIDTKAPVVSNLAVSGSVSGTATISGSSVSVCYINPANATGGYTITGSSTDNYGLASTSYTLTGVDSSGASKTLTGTLGDTSEWTVSSLDLSGFAAQEGADITLTVTACDSAGNTSAAASLILELDTAAPTVTLTVGSSDSDWNKSTALSISGSTSDAGSGAVAVYYKLNGASAYTSLAVASNKFSTTETFAEGTNTLTYYAVDAVGNKSDETTRTVNIDTVTPTVSELPTDSSDYTDFTAQTFGNSTAGVSFAFLAYDGDSKIDSDSISVTIGDYTISKTITTYGTITVTEQPVTLTAGDDGTITGLTAVTKDTAGSVTGYKVKIELKESLGQNLTESNLYTVTATVPDMAGNTKSPQVGILTLDKTPPKVTVTKVSGSAAYVNGVKQVSAILQDTGTIASVSYQIFATSDTSFASPLSFYPVTSVTDGVPAFASAAVESAVIENPDTSLSFYVCTNSSNAAAFADVESFVVCITAVDSAGNSNRDKDSNGVPDSEYGGVSSTYIIDTVAPVLSSDKINGSDYDADNAAANWYNSTTLALSGTWTDSGSGVSAMYYLLDGSDSVSASNKTGTVYPDDSGAYSVNVSGFESGIHSLQFFAVDAAGNSSSVYTHTVSVDVKAPTVTATNNDTSTISEVSGNKSITFTAADASASESGLNVASLVVTIGDNKIAIAGLLPATSSTNGITTYTYTTSLGSVSYTQGTESDIPTYYFTVTPSNSALVADSNTARLESGSTYNVQATVYDQAGNASTTKTVYTYTVDTTPPTVKVSAVSGTDAYARSEKDITVNISDAGLLKSADWAVFAYDNTVTSYDEAAALSSGTLTSESGFEEANATTATFTVSVPTGLSDGATFVVCVRATDEAGNVSSYSGTAGKGGAISSVYTVDTSRPALSDDTIGGITPATSSDTASAWLSDETLTAAGSLRDSGSGVNALYYQLIPADDTTTAPMTADNYTSTGTKVAVSGTTTAFDVNISGFTASSSANTLRYVVVDAVGNVSDLYTRYIWRDSVAPVVSQATDSSGNVITSFDDITTVSTTTISKDFVAVITDNASGIDTESLALVISSGSSSFTVPDSSHSGYGTLTPETYSPASGDSSDSGYTVKANITQALVTALTDGKQYTVTLTGKDKAGNSVSQSLGYLKVDTVAPLVKINGTAAYVNASQDFTVTLTDSSDIASLTWKTCEYEANRTDYSDMTEVETGTLSSPGYSASISIDFSDTKYTDGKAYVLCVIATDSAGNTSSYASGTNHVPYSAAYTVDRTGPALASGSTIGGTQVTALTASTWFTKSTLALSGSWTDSGSGVETMYYLVDSSETVSAANYTGTAKLTAGSTSGSYTYSASLSFEDKEAHSIQYLAVDKLGNTSAVATYTFSVDATAPEVTASSDSPLVNSATPATLTGITISDATSGLESVVWSAGSYNSTADSAYFTVVKPSDSSNSYSVTLTAAGLEALVPAANKTSTSFTLKATVTDVAGNSTTVNVGTISVDNTPPTLSIGAASTYVVKDSTAAVSVTVNDANGIASDTISYGVYASSDVTIVSDSSVTLGSGATALTSGTAGVSSSAATIPAIGTATPTSGTDSFPDGTQFYIIVTASDSVGNSVTKASSLYTVDKAAPAVSDYDLIGTIGSNSWFTNSAVTLSATVSDSNTNNSSLPVSGASYLYYSIDSESDYSPIAVVNGKVSASLSLGEGEHTIRYYAVDALGNQSSPDSAGTIKIDSVKPVVSSSTSDAPLVNHAAAATLSGISISDATSTIDTIVWTVTGSGISYASNDSSVTGYFIPATADDGSYSITIANDVFSTANIATTASLTVKASVTDKAGNSTTVDVGTVNVDNVAPTVSITAPSTYFVSASGTNVTVNANDTNGIYTWDSTVNTAAAENTITYGVYQVTVSDSTVTVGAQIGSNGSKSLSGGTATIAIDTSDGSTYGDSAKFIVRVTAYDKAGNSTTRDSEPYTVDKTAPTVDFAVGSATGGWNKSTSLAITGTTADSGSGAAYVYWTTDKTSDSWNRLAVSNNSFNGSATFSEGETPVYYYVVDAVGNSTYSAESPASVQVKVDTIAPAVTSGTAKTYLRNTKSAVEVSGITFTDANSGTSVSTSGLSYAVVKAGSKEIGSSATENSGISLTNGAVSAIISTDTLASLSGYVAVNATVYDAAGNSTTATIGTLNIDTTAPTLSIASASSYYAKDSVADIAVTVSDANGLSENDSSEEIISYAVYSSSDYDIASDGKVSGTPLVATATTTVSASSATISGIDTSSDTTFPDGTQFVVVVSATDKAGNTKSLASGVYTIDKTAPVFYAGTETTGDYAGYTANSFADTTKWYKDASLSAAGTFQESGSGIAAVYYMVVNDGATAPASADDVVTGGASFSTTDKGSYETFSTTLSGFAEGLNTIYYVAVDNAGNVGSLAASATVYEDTTVPQVTEIASGDSTGSVTIDGSLVVPSDVRTAFDGVTITNGKNSKTLYFFVTDTSDASNGTSGVSLTESDITVKIGSKTLSSSTAATGSYWKIVSIATGTAGGSTVTTKALVKVVLGTDDIGSLSGYNSVTVAVKDNAGNSSETTTVSTLNIDSTAPQVSFTSYLNGSGTATSTDTTSLSSSTTLNKTVTVYGKATDSNEITLVTLTVSASNESGSEVSHTYLSSGAEDATYALSYSDGAWYTVIDTTAYYNGTDSTSLTLSVAATDEAGNTSTAATISPTVNQQKDRPVVKVTSLTQDDDGNYVLKYGTDAQISGTITDDDATSSAVVETFIASSSEISVAEDGTVSGVSGITTLDEDSGEWTFTPAATADGTKTVWFYVKDSQGGVFYTTSSNELSRPYFQYKTSTAVDNDSVISYLSDSTSPVVSAASAVPYTSGGTAGTQADVTTSLIVGGTERSQVQFVLTASDANGIASMDFTVTDSNGSTIASSSVAYSTSGTELVYDATSTDTTTKTYIWTTPGTSLFDLSSAYKGSSGSLSLKVTATDTCGLSNSNTFTFMVDNSAPVIAVSSPSSTEELTSSATVMGTATDSGGASTVAFGFLVPTASGTYNETYYKAQAALLLAAYNAGESYSGTVSDFGGTNAGSAASWQYAFKNSTGQTLKTYEAYDATTYTPTYQSSVYSGSIANENEVWKIPLYFMAVDSLGNYSVKEDYSVLHNPHADIPSTVVSYPNDGDYDTSTDSDGNTLTANYATIGGQIRVTGTVSIEDTNASLGAVYLQVGKVTYETDGTTVKSVDWSYNGTSSAYTASAVTADGLTEHDASAVKTAIGLDDSSSLTFITSTSGSYSASDDFWGLAATVKSSAWNITLNSGEGLNLENDTNYIAIRACAFNGNGKMGAWAGPYYVHVDNDVPDMSVTLQQITALPSYTVSDGQNLLSKAPTVTAEKSYTADMYLRDPNADWYLVVTFTDTSGIDASTIKVSGSSSGKYIYPFEEAGSDGSKYNYKVYIPIVISSTSVSYTVLAYDNDQTAKKSQSTYSLYIDNTAPAVSALTDSSGNAIAMTKLRNSNYVVTIKSTADESGSGFYGAAYYFKRTVDGVTTIELPVPDYSISGTTTTARPGTVLSKTLASAAVELATSDSVSDYVYTSGESEDYSGLPGVWLTGGTRSAVTTFEHALVSDYYEAGLIRIGGFVRIAGSYYQIESIAGDTVTLDGDVATGYTSAFFAMAFVADNTNAEGSSWSSGTQTISKDDGDGIVESVEKSGSTYTWDTSFYSDELDDGPLTVCTAVFDKAGNVTSSVSGNSAYDANADAYVMITNHTPRLTKVFLATDLNGDGSYSDSEFVYGSVHVGTGSAKEYLSALDSGDESATAIVTVGAQGDWKDSSGEETLSGSYFRITDNTVVSMEFVGSTSSDSDYYEGYGIGNGDIYPYLAVGDTALTAPDTTAAHKLGSKLESLGSAVTYTGAANSRGFTLPASTLYNDGAVTTYGSYTESTSESKTQQYLSLTLWDETKGTTVGTGSVVDESATAAGNLTYYTSFGSQYTVLNIPVYFDYVDDQAPEATITPFYWTADADGSNSLYYSSGSKRGHIDLDAYRTGGIPAVSGVIKLEGTAYDDQRIGSIAVYAGGTEIASISYDSASDSFGTAGDSSLTNTGSAGYYYLSASSSFSQSAGHTASWTLLIDTANALSNAESTALTVVATQAKSAGTSGYLTSTPGTVQTASSASTGYYQVAVLPYITEISRVSSTIAGGSMNRSKLGRYAVSEGESLYVYGYNFGTAATARVGSQTATVGSGSTNSSVSGAGYMTITVPAYSGNLTVTATTASENNSNTDPTISDNASTTAALNYNLESYKMKGSTTSYYADDDRYLEVWNMGSGFANTGSTTEFQQPVMTADTSGNLYASWGAASNGQIVFSYGVNGNATPIFNCYDQPAQYTAVAYDKYGTSGGASVMYMGEQQGAGGTYSSTGLSSSMIIGGAFVTNVPETYITAQTESTKKTNVVTGNPSMEMDGDNTTGFYNLSNYDMTRRLGSFSNPQAARYGSYLHNVWYDSNTESLRYSMINVDETNITTNWSNRGAAMANTVVLDGGYTGQDRVHTWTTAELTYETVTTASKKANNTTYYALSVNGTTVGSYSYTDKDVALATYINTSISNNYLTSGGKYHTVMAKGATGNYQANAMYFANDIFLGAGQPKVASRSLCISDVTATSLTMTNVSYTTAPAVGNTIALMVNDLGNYSITLRQITSVSGNTVSWSGAVANYADIDSATIYQGDLNVVNANSLAADGSYTGSSGSSAALDLTSSGYPVVAYFDDNSSTLRIAKATSTTPTTADNWVRTTTSLSCAGSVSLAVDSNSNIHVVYKDEDGQMCYAFGTLNTSTNKYTLKSEVIDATTSSDYTAISVVEDGTSVIPAVTYLANAGTAQSMKYAYRTSSPTASGTFSADNWDYMLLPLIGTGRYALSSNPVSLESRKTGWTGTGTTTFNNGSSYETATPATVQSVVAFKSKTKFETAYLRTEQ